MLEGGRSFLNNTLGIAEIYRKVTVPSAQILTAFTTPVTLVPAIPNCLIYPRYGTITRLAGTAYGGATGNFQLSQSAASTVLFLNVSQLGIIDGTTQVTMVMNDSSLSQVTPLVSAFGQPVVFRFATADPSGGSGDFIFSLVYRVFPNGPLV